MSPPSSFVIDVVETGYRLGGDEDAWLDRVLERLEPELERGLGTFAIAHQFAGERLVLDRFVGRSCPEPVLRFVRAMYENVEAETARAMCSTAGNLRAFSEFVRYLPAAERGAYVEVLAKVGIGDAAIVGYPDGDGGWLTFAAATEKPIRTFPKQRTTWSRMCAHLATAWRLRRRLGTPRTAIEAVVARDGRVLHAEGAALARTQRERLAEGAKAIDKATGGLRRRDPEAALELWRGLVSGRWSLIDRADAGDATVLIAHQNDPATPDPRGLSPRERAIADLVITGASNKHIAYTLGLGHATVAAHLQRALRKLGLHNRLELIRLGALADASVREADVGDAAIRVAVLDQSRRSESVLPLTEAESEVAQLVRDGLSNVEIGRHRGTAERTVANQLASIFDKLGVGSRSELVLALSRST
ncbi:MAG: helix-turn-helix transcriptional regulator [Polyangiaceae bacterium]|nr:helix-turn-helix transcriptional regulator [Polyangiaceae bacterium]